MEKQTGRDHDKFKTQNGSAEYGSDEPLEGVSVPAERKLIRNRAPPWPIGVKPAAGVRLVSKADAVDLPVDLSVAATRAGALDVSDPAVQQPAFAQQGHAVHHQGTREAK